MWPCIWGLWLRTLTVRGRRRWYKLLLPLYKFPLFNFWVDWGWQNQGSLSESNGMLSKIHDIQEAYRRMNGSWDEPLLLECGRIIFLFVLHLRLLIITGSSDNIISCLTCYCRVESSPVSICLYTPSVTVCMSVRLCEYQSNKHGPCLYRKLSPGGSSQEFPKKLSLFYVTLWIFPQRLSLMSQISL